jgi:hypothetical protein
VLTADSDVEVRVGPPADLGGVAHQPADAVDVQALERADLEDAGLEVAAEEGRLDVVT